jgi:VWFA-related protein
MVAGLRRDDFRIFEDKIEQKITALNADAFPLSLVVLVDNDLKQKDSDQVDASLPAILMGMSLSDEADICRFDQFFYPGKGFTKDQDTLLKQLKRTRLASQPSVAPPGGPFNGPSINGAPAPGAGNQDPSLIAIKGQTTKALDDAVYEAAQLLKEKPKERRKIILLISDGKNGAKFNNHKYDEVRNELLRYNIIVYSVATGSSYFDRKFTRLVEYSGDTGGDVSYGAKAETFENFYSQITDQARNQYTLYYSPRGDPGQGYHTIEVRVEREGLNVTARKGYYGGTPQ